MTRVLEQEELMQESNSLKEYNEISKVSQFKSFFVNELKANIHSSTKMLDIGCGPCNYYDSLVELYPETEIHGLDGSQEMLTIATDNVPADANVKLLNVKIPSNSLVANEYDAIISSFALHHITNPNDFWNCVKTQGKKNSKFFILDLLHVDEESVDETVSATAPTDKQYFNADYRASLLSAFTLEEIQQQLKDNNLTAETKITDFSNNLKIVTIFGELK